MSLVCERFERLFATERLYGTLSVIRSDEAPQIVYYVHYLYASFGNGKLICRSRILRSMMLHQESKPRDVVRAQYKILGGDIKRGLTASLASQIWNSMKADNTLDEKEFLGMIPPNTACIYID
ncbi:hypothetical protein Glove_140g26 [Diversispora epigaea]|uniref:Uncharacterized protein n=1 Tax=Diversispora epigaea TaxID=1348612 RepID=A0A397IZK7_9GLOM|nr:hypothetical protein Glove_140g26 [Diversispora epigaea]